MFPIDKIGSGLWYSIHTQSKYVNTKKDLNEFINFFENLIINIPCPVCREHAASYYAMNKIDDSILGSFYYENVDVSVFKWTYDFHNNVNHRLGKKVMEFSFAVNLYMKEFFENYSSSDSYEQSLSCDSCSI